MGKKKKLSAMNLDRFTYKPPTHSDVPVRCRILIVCEGDATEPNYFKSFDKMKHGGVVYEIDTAGGKINTLQVVDKAIELRDRAASQHTPYDAVWAVFDKDDFPPQHFNDAITKAQDNGIGCAWSNEAFELWYVYHFENRTTPTSRNDYQSIINRHINAALNSNEKKIYSYKKNDKDTRHVLTTHGDEGRAIRFAQKQHLSYTDQRYATHNPCTTVYQLVKLLRGEDPVFNQQITDDMAL